MPMQASNSKLNTVLCLLAHCQPPLPSTSFRAWASAVVRNWEAPVWVRTEDRETEGKIDVRILYP
jgi:hypothetical protein